MQVFSQTLAVCEQILSLKFGKFLMSHPRDASVVIGIYSKYKKINTNNCAQIFLIYF